MKRRNKIKNKKQKRTKKEIKNNKKKKNNAYFDFNYGMCVCVY